MLDTVIPRMILLRTTGVIVASLAFGCSSDKAEFGPPKQLTKEQRPTVWDASNQDRLGLPDMRGTAGVAAAGGAAASGAGAGGGGKQWGGTTPDGWESQPANPARFRDAQWKIAGQPDTDIYFTASVGGGVTGNLTRWYRDQFGQPTVPAPEALEIVELAGGTGRLADITGTFQGKAGWAALIAFRWQGEQVTSLKFTGPAAIVKAQRSAFLEVAKSLRQASASPNPKAPPIEPGQPLPPNHPPMGDGTPSPVHGAAPHAAPAAAPAASPFTATIPTGWTAKAGTSRALHHTFGSDGEVYVSQLGGGLKPTLDIWRGEVSLQPMSDAEFQALPKAAFLGDDAVLLDLQGNFQSMSGKQIQGARVLVMARVDSNSITFAKLVGPAADVAPQVDAFRTFCGSVRRKS
jgi:hypothetical protein